MSDHHEMGRFGSATLFLFVLPCCAPAARLAGRAVLPAATFAEGPTSGTLLGDEPINGVEVPFRDRQPVQGFSAVVPDAEREGAFFALTDNGFGSMEVSADYNLRIYRLRVELETARGGGGEVSVEGFIELSDPDRVGRHVGAGAPDDSELILIELSRALW